jgi:hypothetical protein
VVVVNYFFIDVVFLQFIHVCTFCWKCRVSIILFIGPKVCELSRRCLEKLEALLLVLKDKWCSLDLWVKLLPVCPTYAFLQSRYVSLYTPLGEYLFYF